MDIWSLLAYLLVSVLSGVVTAGLIVTIGGLGVQRALSRRLTLAEERVEDVDHRITREVKTRAGQKAAEDRAGRRSDAAVAQEATEILAQSPANLRRPGRPSIFHRKAN